MRCILVLSLLAAAPIGHSRVEALPLHQGRAGDQQNPVAASARPYLLSLSVANLDATASWYRDVLGFREVRHLELPDYRLRIRFLELNGFRLELIQYQDSVSLASIQSKFPNVEDRARVHGFGKLAFAVDDLAAAARALKDKKVKLLRDVSRDEATGDRWMLIEDPEGNWLQFFEARK